MRKEEEEIQKEMARIRKEMDEERRKQALEESRYHFTVLTCPMHIASSIVCLS